MVLYDDYSLSSFPSPTTPPLEVNHVIPMPLCSLNDTSSSQSQHPITQPPI